MILMDDVASHTLGKEGEVEPESLQSPTTWVVAFLSEMKRD